MENKVQTDLKKEKVVKIAKIIAWSFILYPLFGIICGFMNITGPFVLILFFMFFLSPFIAIFYAAINKVFIRVLLLPLIINIILIILFIGLFIDIQGNPEAAKAARIKAAMDQFKSVAENYKAVNRNYGALINMKIVNNESCEEIPNSLISEGSDGKILCDDIQSQKGGGELVIYSNTTAYCIQKILPGKPEVKWCLDSRGNVESTHAECNLNNFSCEL